ncbi:MAG: glycosyltransferase [Thermoanaerobaculia bacterium]|nr:glycosyltransferase [Thermoanaerobaculia bacterium]
MSTGRLEVDYLSPLPPRRTGIAEYSMDLLPELSSRCDLRVIRLGDDEGTSEVEERWHPAPLTSIGEGGRLPLFQMGNNRNHELVYRTALTHPGVLTLHDLVLHHFHQERLLSTEDFDGYCHRLEMDHGWIGKAVAMPIRWTGYSAAAVFALPVHRELLLAQRGILVHSRWSAGVLAEELPEARVRAVPMGIPLPPPVDPERGRDFRRRHRLPLDVPLLGSFGFQTPIKRTEIAVRALARPELATAHLVVVGEVSPTLGLEGEARSLGVADRLHVLGYVPFEELEAAIAATDLCLNLRYPTAGETSASLLRVFALGCPAIVSDYAQFAELPDAFAIKVPLGVDEVEALAVRGGELLGDPQHLYRLGEAARRHVAVENSPAVAAAAVVAACEEWQQLPSPAGPEELGTAAAAPTSLTVWPMAEMVIQGPESGEPGERREVMVRLVNRGRSRWLAAERGTGGLALSVELLDEQGTDHLADAPWIPLARDVAPGASIEIPLRVRPPVGVSRLTASLEVLGWEGRGHVATETLQFQ